MTANEQTRRDRIDKALEALSADHEKMRVPWRDGMESMSVIKLELDSCVLNPRSHRIKSQLESEPELRKQVEEDPESQAAQEGIRDLLTRTPGFAHLKENLGHAGQTDPGIITADGRLINANTRAAALHQLGNEYIEVAVLPKDATPAEIANLELDLQVAEDFKQDYSFTNTLLFVDDLINEYNRDEQDIAIRLRWSVPTKQSSIKSGVDKVKRYVRHLAVIREIQAISGNKVPLTDFDDAEQTLQEFDSKFEALRTKDPSGAERMKRARILGLLVNLGYERQREVDAEWVETYLAEAFSENDTLKEIAEGLEEADAGEDGGEGGDGGLEGLEGLEELEGTDETTDEDQDAAHKTVGILIEKLGGSADADSVTIELSGGPKTYDRQTLVDQVNDAMRMAAEDAKNAQRAGDKLKLPHQQAEDAAKRLSKALTAYVEVKDDPEFDKTTFMAAVERAERALDALKLADDQ